MDRGIVWESADGHGALVLVPPEEADALDDALAIDDSQTHKMTDDGGRRYELFWDWVGSNIPREPLWHLDSVAVAPGWRGRGIEHGAVLAAVSEPVGLVVPVDVDAADHPRAVERALPDRGSDGLAPFHSISRGPPT